jgi:lipopolysaccharide transport system ATP-binding protein
MNKFAIEIQDVWKSYNIQSKQRPSTVKSALFNQFNYWANREKYWALQGVSLAVPQGKTVGLIGANGAGKSTLLRIISGLTRPTRGKMIRRGRLGTLLELGAGFNEEFTGRENVITGSIIAGLTRKEAEARLPEVIAFSELEDFIDSPVRTYSKGMFVRLAFATEINLDPDILLVDEVLAVGDMAFQKKCLAYLEQIRQQGKTIIVVSHAMDQIENVADEVIWLEQGKVRMQGETNEVIQKYRNRVYENTKRIMEQREQVLAGATTANDSLFSPAPADKKPTGTQEIEIISVQILNEAGQAVDSIISGEGMILEINYFVHTPVDEPIFMVTVVNDKDIRCFELDTASEGIPLGQLNETGCIRLFFNALPLQRGSYFISTGIHQQNWEYSYDYRHKTLEFTVEGATTGTGILFPLHRWIS